MRLRQYDPKESLSYLTIVSEILGDYSTFQSPQDIIRRFGGKSLTDITEAPEIRLPELTPPLPIGYEQKVFQFKESGATGGSFDVVFNNEGQMINFRAQLFFEGMLAGMRAAYYNRLKLRTLIEQMADTGNVSFDNRSSRYYGYGNELMVTFCQLSDFGLTSVSTWITQREETCLQTMAGYSGVKLQPNFIGV
ncbi:hypothetical protein [Dehalococcoides sp. UCH007]|uniref:hypothetical protein n=1 Tax=Dehalococcoides sp. UCH007 TaxID=1522671 RepID=UPI0005B56EBA|nr:hypothetical protein [Dehalococcoides sp. UCH007]BAQ35111.1 hypothetical protein UCH007_11530 [Dehalococcoides sp. UCH007]